MAAQSGLEVGTNLKECDGDPDLRGLLRVWVDAAGASVTKDTIRPAGLAHVCTLPAMGSMEIGGGL